MGSYSCLRIRDLSLYEIKSTVEPVLMTIFCESDKRVRPGEITPKPSQSTEAESLNDSFVESETGWDSEPYEVVEYATSLSVARDRLEVMEFTLLDVTTAFMEGINERLTALEEQLADPAFSDFLRPLYEKERTILSSLTFDKWLETFAVIVAKNLWPDSDYWYGHKPAPDGLTPLMCYMLSHVDSDDMYGFPCCDFRAFLRAAVEIADTEAELVYDLTDLVSGGYINASDQFCSSAKQGIAAEFSVNHKIIVLTER